MSAHAIENGGASARILLVEDTLIVAELVASVLHDCECAVVGPFATVDEALEAAETESSLTGAVLDVNLDGGWVFPVAETLRRKGVPIIFLTGYNRSVLPPVFENCEIIEKPFFDQELVVAIRRIFHEPRLH
jgi:CheY-like chemotaxis protein